MKKLKSVSLARQIDGCLSKKSLQRHEKARCVWKIISTLGWSLVCWDGKEEQSLSPVVDNEAGKLVRN